MARAPRRLTSRLSAEEAIAEGILLAGGGRALLLQIADPAIAEGVARHSEVGLEPVRRLTGTLEYLYVLAFGSEEEQRLIARQVGLAHRGVRGDGNPQYDARDPDLQLWVSATLYDTAVLLLDTLGVTLTEESADDLYRQLARTGTALGLPASAWPADRAAFGDYWAGRVARLEVTPTARALARTLLRPEQAPLWLRAVLPLARLVTAGLLPPEVRTGYRVRWDAERQRRFERRFSGLLAVYRVLPAPVRRAPGSLLLRRFRARARAVHRTNQGERGHSWPASA